MSVPLNSSTLSLESERMSHSSLPIYTVVPRCSLYSDSGISSSVGASTSTADSCSVLVSSGLMSVFLRSFAPGKRLYFPSTKDLTISISFLYESRLWSSGVTNSKADCIISRISFARLLSLICSAKFSHASEKSSSSDLS